MTEFATVKNDLERTSEERDVLQKDLKQLSGDHEVLQKIRNDLETELRNVQACLSAGLNDSLCF